jgi:hypothetical protein
VRRLVALILAAAAVLVAGGCGGAKHYDIDASRGCLRGVSGIQVRALPPSDFIAKTALEGAMNVKFPANQVTLSFSQDDKQADGIARAYRRFRGKGIGIESALEELANVVMVWAVTPKPTDKSVIHDCLKG